MNINDQYIIRFGEILKSPFKEVSFAELQICKDPTIPFIHLKLEQAIPGDGGFGHIKKWIETNIKNTVYVYIFSHEVDPKKTNIKIPYSKQDVELKNVTELILYICFSEIEDYTAFKLMYEQYC